MLHEIHPDFFDNAYLPFASPNEDDAMCIMSSLGFLLKRNLNAYSFPLVKDLDFSSNSKPVFLFRLNQQNFFAGELNNFIPSDFEYLNINELRNIEQQTISFTALVATQLITWYSSNRFCGKCGHSTLPGKNERNIVCSTCQHTIYPKISPAIIVAITSNDRILLAHNNLFRNNYFSLIAGYADIGESLEETVIREVREEVGITVYNIRYYKSQPWPLSGSMMIGYFAEADENQIIKVDNKEIAKTWCYQGIKCRLHPTNQSIAGEMIELFKSGKIPRR